MVNVRGRQTSSSSSSKPQTEPIGGHVEVENVECGESFVGAEVRVPTLAWASMGP